MHRLGKFLVFSLVAIAFTIVPINSVEYDASAVVEAVPGGGTIGLKLYLDGLLVVGMSDIKSGGTSHSPGKQGGILKGDRITHVNGQAIDSTSSFTRMVQENGSAEMTLDIVRGGNNTQKKVTPVLYDESRQYKIGVWVRDSASGIGTITFMLSDGSFAALGHGISDVDTQQILEVSKSEVTGSNVSAIIKGKEGAPGELRGAFDDTSKGVIYENNKNGIYGHLSKNNLNSSFMEIEKEEHVQEGYATILCNVEGNSIEEFSIEIQKVMRYNNSDGKCMVIKVTDEALLEKTGGIVQGMSGSPVIQNGKIVGAVTHVFLNDPTKGYGIFAQRMLFALNSSNNS